MKKFLKKKKIRSKLGIVTQAFRVSTLGLEAIVVHMMNSRPTRETH